MTGTMLARQLSWTLATCRSVPSTSRRQNAATSTPHRASSSSSDDVGGGGGAKKKPRKTVRRVAGADVTAGAADAPPAPVRRRASSEATASVSSEASTAGAGVASHAVPKSTAATKKTKTRTVRRLKNNVAVAEAVQERARLDENPAPVEVSARRIAEETLAAAKFTKLAAKIAKASAADELAIGVGAENETATKTSPFGGGSKTVPDAALVPRTLSILEQVRGPKLTDGDNVGTEDSTSHGGDLLVTDSSTAGDGPNGIHVRGKKAELKLKNVPPDETPGERLKRLFREKRSRGLARVRDKFANQELFDEISGSFVPPDAEVPLDAEEKEQRDASLKFGTPWTFPKSRHCFKPRS
jgi:hypothetical protein